MNRSRPTLIACATLAFALAAPAALAEYVDVAIIPVPAQDVDAPDGYQVWRAVARFTSETDYVLSVAGYEVAPIEFETNDPEGLLNLENLEGCLLVEGTPREDFATNPQCAAWDSYVTIGHTQGPGNDTKVTADFLDGDGASNVVEGSYFLEIGIEGWYDSNPGNVFLAGPSLQVVIAQLTVRTGFDVRLCGFIEGVDGNGAYGEAFCAGSQDECGCPEDVNCDGFIDFDDLLAVLAAWGSPGGREDVDGDGEVGFGDVLRILARWGRC